jgi:two-component system nitrogen regulation response regulator NtrX
MSLDAQAKVLRVLEEMQIERVGGVEPIPVDVWVIAATNKNIVEQVKNGRFREDLYYRLNVVPIHVPPLRERRGDISGLINYYLECFAEENNKKVKQMEPEAMRFLTRQYNWPGNIRELKNLVERLTILAGSEVISLEEVQENLPHFLHTGEEIPGFAVADVEMGLKQAREDFEKRYILTVLKSNEYNISRTARALRIERSNLYKLMKRLGIQSR